MNDDSAREEAFVSSSSTIPLLTLGDVAGELRVTIDWVRRHIWARRLPALKVGGLVTRADLNDFLVRCRQGVYTHDPDQIREYNRVAQQRSRARRKAAATNSSPAEAATPIP